MNILHQETSPYLLQHANNPIWWKPWQEETLEQAMANQQLIIVSIGYAACHWCHVMEHECFENEEVASIMNAHFVSIKVDREERPDVDAIYMKALQLMTGQGGWPLNVVCLPDGRPVWGATYVNKESWCATLEQLQHLFLHDREKMVEYADKLQMGIHFAGLVEPSKPLSEGLEFTKPLLEKWEKSFDWDSGGPARAPKFMMPNNLEYLQSYAHLNNNKTLMEYVDLTMTKMAWGGLFDVVDGGFSRYAVDMRWHIPHFEKMLYDNAQLLSLYAKGYQRTKNPLYLEVVEKTIGFMEAQWLTSDHGFYTSLDADSINASGTLEEGAFYYWDLPELDQLLGADFDLFKTVFNINDYGHWEHNHYVFIQTQPLQEIAIQLQMEFSVLKSKLNAGLEKLKDYRANRAAPRLDNKIITSWNAMTVTAYTDVYKATGAEKYLEQAKKSMAFITTKLLDQDTLTLTRTWTTGKKIMGFLEDYAFVIKALLDLYEVTADVNYKSEASQLTAFVVDHFFNTEKHLFEYKDQADTPLIAKHYEIEDNVIPSANSVMAHNLYILGYMGDQEHLSKLAVGMLEVVWPNIDYASAFSNWLQLYTKMQHGLYLKTGAPQSELKEIHKHFAPQLYVIPNGETPEGSAFQMCNSNSCFAPTNSIQDVLKATTPQQTV